jgi:hypothetical protein
MNDFLMEKDIQYLTLCGKSGNKHLCDIVYTNHDSMHTKLVSNWKNCCTANNFKRGDQIRFKFFDPTKYHMVHVYQINNLG